MIHLCVSLILHGPCPHIMEVLSALQAQELDDGTNISVVIVDNGVPETVRAEIFEGFGGTILLLRNRENLGFSAAANQSVAEAQRYKADFLLLLNPDLLLETLAIRELLRAAARNPHAAMLTPRLLRANEDLSPTSPATLDACGMIMTPELRHLDRASGELDKAQYDKEEQVFGGSGACLFIRLSAVHDLFLPRTGSDKALWKIYPQLEQGQQERPQLLDEAFFAYREDADLAWRAQIRGKQVVYCPAAIGHHVRRVTPEARASLPPEINLWSVRNRFLMQINNLRLLLLPSVVIPGFILRNLMVICAVIVRERSSLPALSQIAGLFRRGVEQRRFIMSGVSAESYRRIGKWFAGNKDF